MQDQQWPELPVLITEIPGPKSRSISAEERKLRSSGTSAGSQWSELAIVDGKDCMVRDIDGNIFLDACSGTVVMNIGHGNERVAKAVYQQCQQLTHFYDFPSPIRLNFLNMLKRVTPSTSDSFLLLNSGAEAVESALRISRSYTGRYEIIAFKNGYHGRTLGALSLTSGAGRKGLGPLLPGVFLVSAPRVLSTDGDAAVMEKVNFCIEEFQTTIDSACDALPAAVVIEPIQGAGGTHPMPKEFLEFLREYCTENGILLVFDEILTGAGRTGKMWAHEHVGIEPDLLLAGKGMAGGLPFGMLGGPSKVLNGGPMGLPTRNSSTFGGNPVVCAAGLVTLEELTSSNLLNHASEVGAYLIADLRKRLMGFASIKDIRGAGLMIGIEVNNVPAGKTPMGDLIKGFLLEMMKKGAVVSSTSAIIRITPPLSLTKFQAAWLAQTIEDCITSTFEEAFSD